MPQSDPRYEFRVWNRAFPKLPQPDSEPWSEETYLLVASRPDTNVKLRGDVVEIKELVKRHHALELWRPGPQLDFPLTGSTLGRELLPRLPLDATGAEDCPAPADLLQLARASGAVLVIALRKRRRLFEVMEARAEVTEVEVGERRSRTAAVEHERPEVVEQAARTLGLDAFPNLSYPAALASGSLPG